MSSEDIIMITDILSGYTNPNNIIRKTAEAKLNDLRKNLGAIAYCLLSVTSNQSLQFTLKKTALVLLRQILIKDWQNNNWVMIQPNLKQEIKAISLKLLLQETDSQLQQHYCDVISQFIEIIESTKETWPEIHQLLYQMYTHQYNFTSQTDLIQIKTLLILLNSSIHFFIEEMNKDINKLYNLIQCIFLSNIIELQVLCCTMIKEYLLNCKSENDTFSKFSDYIVNIFQLAVTLFNKNDETNLIELIFILIEIAEEQGSCFEPFFKGILSFVSTITKKNDYHNNEKVRELAFELIVTLFEQDYSLFQNDISYLKQFIFDLYAYAFDISRTIPEEWKNPKINSNEDAPVIPEDNLKFVQETIERLQMELEMECVDIVLDCVQSMFNKKTDDWVYTYIGLISLSHIMCYINDMTSIEHYFPFIYQMLLNPNCKIRYAAAHCIDQISDSFNPLYQNQTGIKLIEKLMNTAFEEKVPIVQSKLIEALTTFISFIETKELFTNDSIIQKLFDFLFQLFSRNDLPVMIRTEILKCNIELIRIIEEDCSPYAKTVLEILTQYFAYIYSNQINKCLYGIVISNITLIGKYTEVTYAPIVPDLIKTIIEIIETLKHNINPLRSHIQNSIERIIPITKNKYPEKIALIIQSLVMLIKTANNNPQQMNKNIIEVDKSLLTNEENNDNESGDDNESEKSNDKNSLDPDDLVDCVDIIDTLVETLEEDFIPYINQIENDIVEMLLRTNYPKLINKICLLFASIIDISDDQMKKEKGQKYIKLIINVLEREIYFQKTSSLFATLGTIIDNLGVIYTKDELHQLFSRMVMFFDTYNAKRTNLSNKQRDSSKNYQEISQLKDLANELNAKPINSNPNKNISSNSINQAFKPIFKFFKTDIKQIETIQKQIIQTIGTIIKIYKNESSEIINACLTKLIPKYITEGQSGSSFIQLMVVFLIDDLIELGPNFFDQDNWALLYKILIDLSKSKDYQMIRAISYGLGHYSKQCSITIFDPIASSVIQTLYSMNETPTKIKIAKKKRKYLLSKDNIIAALGKIIKYQSNGAFIKTNLPKLLLYWISNLPIQLEDDEIEEQHLFLCDVIISDGYSIMKSQHSKNILNLLIRIYQPKLEKNIINKKLKEMFKAMKQDKDILSLLEGYFSSNELNGEMKKLLKTLMEES